MTSDLVLRRHVLDGANRYLWTAAYVVELDEEPLRGLTRERVEEVLEALGVAGAAVPGRLLMPLLKACGGSAPMRVQDETGRSPVVAVGWTDLQRVEALVDGFVTVLGRIVDGASPGEVAALAREVAAGLTSLPAGRRPDVVEPWFPVAGITGTNGKTSTTRLLVHIGRAAGHRVASCDTDGVRLDDEVLRTGDWSGPGGADVALHAPGATLGVLEIARGGLLRSGVGVSRLDVGVLLNVRDDHLGEGGVDDLVALADVKGAVLRGVAEGGVRVVNAEDRLARLQARDGPSTKIRWFAVDPADLPGPGAAVVDGSIAILGNWSHGRPPPRDPATEPLIDEAEQLVPLADVPLAAGGASRAGVENCLAAAAAALALGLPREAIVEGLRSFGRDPADNRGRLERWQIDGRIVLHDVAHNPDGLGALLGLGRALSGAEGRLIALIGTAGDRRDEDLRALGRAAGELADVVLTADKPRYLRDREAGELRALLAAGVREAGSRVTHLASELEGVATAWSRSRRGDVLALCVHEQRDEVDAWLREHGARPQQP